MQQVAGNKIRTMARVNGSTRRATTITTASMQPGRTKRVWITVAVPWSHKANLVGRISFKLQWTIFDLGRDEKNKVGTGAPKRPCREATTRMSPANKIADAGFGRLDSELDHCLSEAPISPPLLEAATNHTVPLGIVQLRCAAECLELTAGQRILPQARSDWCAGAYEGCSHRCQSWRFPKRGFIQPTRRRGLFHECTRQPPIGDRKC